MMKQETKSEESDELRARVAALETGLAEAAATVPAWSPRGYYTTYHLLAGAVLGLKSASAGLLFDVFAWTMLLVDQWGRFTPYRTAKQEPAR